MHAAAPHKAPVPEASAPAPAPPIVEPPTPTPPSADAPAPAPEAPVNRTFEIVDDVFLRNGEPVQIISGSIHYFRIRPEVRRCPRPRLCGTPRVHPLTLAAGDLTSSAFKSAE